jgi:hypothetical protein
MRLWAGVLSRPTAKCTNAPRSSIMRPLMPTAKTTLHPAYAIRAANSEELLRFGSD